MQCTFTITPQRVWKELLSSWGFPGGSAVKTSVSTELRGVQVRSLGWESPLEKELATHSSILTWEIPWTKEPGRLLSMGLQRVGYY